MRYLLDTNAWISYLNPGVSRVRRRIEASRQEDIGLCSVVKAELFFGAYKSPRTAENLSLLARVSATFSSLPFGDDAADHYGQIRAELERAGAPIGPNDLMIAAIARANDLTLVTHNTGEFGRIPGLKMEDWEA